MFGANHLRNANVWDLCLFVFVCVWYMDHLYTNALMFREMETNAFRFHEFPLCLVSETVHARMCLVLPEQTRMCWVVKNQNRFCEVSFFMRSSDVYIGSI